MAEIPLFFLFAYYSDYVDVLRTDPELLRLCWVDNEYSCLNLEAYLPQYKTIYTYNDSV